VGQSRLDAADLGKLEHDERARYAAVIRKIGLKIK
jgi:hypothetical protein